VTDNHLRFVTCRHIACRHLLNVYKFRVDFSKLYNRRIPRWNRYVVHDVSDISGGSRNLVWATYVLGNWLGEKR